MSFSSNFRTLSVLSASVFAAATFLSTPVEAQGSTKDSTLTRFTEVFGNMEFTGRMIARPLQVQRAREYGMARAEVRRRVRNAEAALAAYPLVEYVEPTDEYIIEVGLGNENLVANELMARGNFEYVEPDWRVFPIGCPNDSQFGSQWHHNANRMNSCNGWDLETGSTSVVVAICDTGVELNHEDLEKHRMEGYNAVDKKWESAGGQVNDINGHGTMTTGCAAAKGNNNKGVVGTGWRLSPRMMRVSNSSSGSSSISTLTHAAQTAALAGDRVASVSYSGGTSSSVSTTGDFLRSKGALLIWAADNAGNNYKGNRDDGAIMVGATDSSDNRSSFSSYGNYIDLFAPGSSIFTTTTGNGYGSASGTSFATPLTAGLVGLIFSADPTLTPDQAEYILRYGCDDLGSIGEDSTFGYGRIEVHRTMQLIYDYETLFADDFESGDFIAGGWSLPVGKAKVKVRASDTGGFGARIRNTGIIERAVSTSAYDQIALLVSRRSKNYDSGESLEVEWFNGSTWNSVDTVTARKWNGRFIELPSGADNNPSFKIRFRSVGNMGRERGDVDDVKVIGIKI
jgi:subtilisin family serine protease